jgi:copper chaperone CopZ
MNEQTKLAITGMSCVKCVEHVTQALTGVSGVSRARVDLSSGEAEVEYDPSQASFEQMEGAVKEAGYSIAQQTETPQVTQMTDDCCSS